MLHVPSEAQLQFAVARIEAAGIRCVRFYEPDEDMGVTAVCTEPVGDGGRRIFKRFSLWREPSANPRERGPPGHLCVTGLTPGRYLLHSPAVAIRITEEDKSDVIEGVSLTGWARSIRADHLDLADLHSSLEELGTRRVDV